MDTAFVTYRGGLRTEAVHLRSGERLITDAPVDNKGRGEAFSPTDLLCVSLATCILTTMGIGAEARSIELAGATARVVKHMAADPRRVARIEVHLELDGASLSVQQRALLERIAHTCPVALSLSPEVVQEITFTYR
ncbi:MAG: OsmC family protein [Flavobacteriales bacterium]